MFIDSQNHALFHINGLFQTQFDAAVASLWLYWRPTTLFANSRGFVTASENRTELTDCISSLDDVISKVINHMNNEVMRSIFDVKHSGKIYVSLNFKVYHSIHI